jgi:hypothetical protein
LYVEEGLEGDGGRLLAPCSDMQGSPGLHQVSVV